MNGESLLFLHVPKTGGITLREIIARQYPAARIYTIKGKINEATTRFRELPRSRRAALQVLQGHMSYGLHTYLEAPTTYITMLRDPMRRALSDYAFVTSTESHPLFPTVRDMTLIEYLRSGVTGQLANGQTRLICGDADPEQPGIPTLKEITDQDLARAERNLTEHFAVVGVQERFDETLLLLRRRFGWRLPFYVKENVTRVRLRPADIDAAARRVIETQNALDVKLYRFARERLDRQIEAQGTSFRVELAVFRALNRLYGLIASLGWKRIRFRLGTLRRRLRARLAG